MEYMGSRPIEYMGSRPIEYMGSSAGPYVTSRGWLGKREGLELDGGPAKVVVGSVEGSCGHYIEGGASLPGCASPFKGRDAIYGVCTINAGGRSWLVVGVVSCLS